MNIDDRIRDVAAGSAWCHDMATALAIVPGLADLPILVEGADKQRSVLPLAVIEPLAGPVLDAVEQLVAAHDAGAARESWHQVGAEAALRDPVVAVLVGLHLDAARPGLRLGNLATVGVAWIASRVLTANAGDVVLGPAGLTSRGRALQRYVAGLEVRARGPLLAAVAWGLQGRLGAAASIAMSASPQVVLGPLHRAFAQSPLALTCARGTLDAERDHGLLVALLGLDLRPATLDAAHLAVAALMAGPLAAAAGPAATPALLAAQDLLRRRGLLGATSAAVLLDPVAGVTLLASVPDLFGRGDLEKAGLPKALAHALMQRDACRALAATWRDATEPLLQWDLLTAVLDRVVPVLRGTEVAVDGFAWDIGVWQRALLFPPLTTSVGAIVAADLSALGGRLQSDRHEARSSGSWGFGPLWDHLTGGAGFCQGSHGLALCESVERAIDLALSIDSQVKAGFVLPRGHLGEPVEFPRGGALGLAVVGGVVSGVSDGLRLVLDGPTFARAVSLAGCASVDAMTGTDSTGMRGVVHTPDGVSGSGVALDRNAVEALHAGLEDHRTPRWTPEHTSTLPGFDRGFKLLPIDVVWSSPAGLRLMLRAGAEGPPEVMSVEEVDLRDLLTRDADLEQRRIRQGASLAPAAASAVPDWGFDESSSVEAAPVLFGTLVPPDAERPQDDPFDAFDVPAGAATADADPFAFFDAPPTPPEPPAGAAPLGSPAATDPDVGDFGDFGDFGAFGASDVAAGDQRSTITMPTLSAPPDGAGASAPDLADLFDGVQPVFDPAENPFSDLSVSGGGSPVDPWEADDDAVSGPLQGFDEDVAPTVPPTRLISAPMALNDDDFVDNVETGTSADLYAGPVGSGPAGWMPRQAGEDADKAGDVLAAYDPDDFAAGGASPLAMVGPPMMLEETDPGDQAPHQADWSISPAAALPVPAPPEGDPSLDGGAALFVVPDFGPSADDSDEVGADPLDPPAPATDQDQPTPAPFDAGDEPRFNVPWELAAPDQGAVADGPMVDIEEEWDDVSSDAGIDLQRSSSGASAGMARAEEPPWTHDLGGGELPTMGTTPDGPSLSPILGHLARGTQQDGGGGDADADALRSGSAFPPDDQLSPFDRALSDSFPSVDPGPGGTLSVSAPGRSSPRRDLAPALPSATGDSSNGLNLAGMFAGYREYESVDGAITFGMRDGPRLRDAHRYAVSGDRSEAYRRFLKDKVAEGFAPRLELTAPFSADANTAREIDGALLASAYSRMFT